MTINKNGVSVEGQLGALVAPRVHEGSGGAGSAVDAGEPRMLRLERGGVGWSLRAADLALTGGPPPPASFLILGSLRVAWAAPDDGEAAGWEGGW